jgi:hypothetical protein
MGDIDGEDKKLCFEYDWRITQGEGILFFFVYFFADFCGGDRL